MPAIVILAAAAMGLVLVVLAAVVVGIRQEPPSQELTGQAPRLMARLTRCLVGAYVCRPDLPVIPASSAGNRATQRTVARRPTNTPQHKIRDT
jgi:hypothetical protein